MSQPDPNKNPGDPNDESKITKFLSNLNPSTAIGNLFGSVNHLIFIANFIMQEILSISCMIRFHRALLISRDETTRMIITSVISIPLWIVTNRNNSILYRVRNLAFIFAGVGIFFCPQIFNPFLPEIKTKPKSL